MRREKNLFVPALAFWLLLAATPVSGLGDPFTVSISPEAAAVYAGKTAQYNVSITNNLNVRDTIEIFIHGRARTPWITLNTYSLNLTPEETGAFTFYITPSYGTKQDTYTFDFTASSKTNSTFFVKKEVIVFVLETSGLNITTFQSAKNQYDMGEKITILIGVKNAGTSRSKRTYMDLKIIGATNAERSISIPPLEVDEEKILSEEFIFDKYAAHGSYDSSVELFNELGDRIGSGSAAFSVESRPIFEKEERAKSGFLYRDIDILIRNTGNERGTETISKDAPLFSGAYVYEKEPVTETRDGAKKVVWRCDLAPNESCTIRYEVRYWPYLFSVLLAIMVLYMAIRRLEKPGITKKYVRGKEHKVHIEIKNNSRRTLEEVHVSDFVPSAFEVIEDVGTVRPTVVKRRTGGTDITWTIGKVAPGEERIFTYKVRPAVDLMGKINLPHAKITAKDIKGRKYNGISSKIVVD